METQSTMKIFHFEGNKVEIKQQESQVIRQCLHNFHMAYIVCCVLEEGTYLLIGLSPLRRINEYQWTVKGN